MRRLLVLTECIEDKTILTDAKASRAMAGRLKQWLKIAARFGDFPHFDAVKAASTVEELFSLLAASPYQSAPLGSPRVPVSSH